jgi:hypothetical protein
MAQTTRRQDLGAVEDHRVLQRPAQGQTAGAHRIHVGLPAEGAAVGQLAHEGAIGHVQPPRLHTDRLVGEIDAEVDLQHLGRLEPRHGRTVAHFHRLQHAHGTHRQILFQDPGSQEALDEGHRRAIEDRHFRSVDLDQGVVNGKPGQRGHDMLDGRDRDAIAVFDHRAKL